MADEGGMELATLLRNINDNVGSLLESISGFSRGDKEAVKILQKNLDAIDTRFAEANKRIDKLSVTHKDISGIQSSIKELNASVADLIQNKTTPSQSNDNTIGSIKTLLGEKMASFNDIVQQISKSSQASINTSIGVLKDIAAKKQ